MPQTTERGGEDAMPTVELSLSREPGEHFSLCQASFWGLASESHRHSASHPGIAALWAQNPFLTLCHAAGGGGRGGDSCSLTGEERWSGGGHCPSVPDGSGFQQDNDNRKHRFGALARQADSEEHCTAELLSWPKHSVRRSFVSLSLRSLIYRIRKL